MHRFPSKSTMFILILILAIISTIRYASKIDTQLIQNFFDWDEEVWMHSYDNLKMDSVSYNYLRVRNFPGKHQPNNQNTFAIVNQKGQKYYFRFIYLNRKNETASFSGIEWLTGVPELSERPISITESHVPLKKTKGKTIVTIGNHLLVKNEAKYFRREISSRSNVNFDGRLKDVFNFKHEAIDGVDWMNKIIDVNSIPLADIYVVFGDFPKDLALDEELRRKLNGFLHQLSTKSNHVEIIWVLLPAVKNELENQKRIELNEFIKSLDNSRVVLLDAYSLFEDDNNYLMSDSIQLNKNGYQKLAHEIVELIN